MSQNPKILKKESSTQSLARILTADNKKTIDPNAFSKKKRQSLQPVVKKTLREEQKAKAKMCEKKKKQAMIYKAADKDEVSVSQSQITILDAGQITENADSSTMGNANNTSQDYVEVQKNQSTLEEFDHEYYSKGDKLDNLQESDIYFNTLDLQPGKFLTDTQTFDNSRNSLHYHSSSEAQTKSNSGHNSRQGKACQQKKEFSCNSESRLHNLVQTIQKYKNQDKLTVKEQNFSNEAVNEHSCSTNDNFEQAIKDEQYAYENFSGVVSTQKDIPEPAQQDQQIEVSAMTTVRKDQY